MALIQAVLAGLVALIITPGLLFYFDVTPKVVVLLVGVAFLICWPGLRPAKALTFLIVAALLSLALSTVFSGNPSLSLFGTNWRRYGSVVQAASLLFAWVVASHPERSCALMRSISITATAAGLYGIAQYFGWDPLLPSAQYHIGEGIWSIVRPPGTMGYVSYFATWLLMAAFLSFGLASKEQGRWRMMAWTGGAIALVAMSLSGTRAALLGLAAGTVVWLLGRGFRVTRRMAAAAVVIGVAVMGFYFSPAGWQMRSRARWFSEDRWGGARPLLWRDSLSMGIARPLMGHGPEVFTAAFPRYESKELARAYPDFSHESPHNMFLDALVGQGFTGFAILLALCVTALQWAWRGGKPWLAAALTAGIVSQQFTVFTVPTAMLFFTCVGLAAESSPLRQRRWFLAPVAVLLVYAAIRYGVADRSLELARRALTAGDLRAGVEHYAAYEKQKLPGTSADLWYSRSLLSLAQKTADPVVKMQAVTQAGIAGARAPRTVEDPFDAWYSLAAIYAARDDAAHTEESLRAAIAAHPNWSKPHQALAQLLLLQGRSAEGAKEAALAADLQR